MKRLALFTLAAVFLVGCQDSTLIEDIPAPQFAWSDATSDPVGNQYFTFLTPIRPSPSGFAAPFNPYADPSVTIYELPDGFDFVGDRSCAPLVGTAIAATLSPIVIPTDPLTGEPKDEYETNWSTGEDHNVFPGRVYRICVTAFSQELGFRDVGPQADPVDGSRDVAQDPIYGFNNGRNIPISFHIAFGAGCSLEENIDCTETLFEPGVAQVATCDDGLCGGAAQAGTFSEPTPVRIQLVECPRDLATGQITHLGVETDIPLFPGCLEVETLDGSQVNIPAAAPFVAGACIDLSPEQTGSLPHRQFDLLQLHHARTNADGSVTVEALPQVPFTGVLSCEGFEESFAAAGPQSGLMQFAERGLRSIQEIVGPWFSPASLTAGDRGVGGSMFGDGAFSPAVWGLPVQQERGQIVDGEFVAWHDVEIGEVGTAFVPAVRVLDAGTAECADPDCVIAGPQPVAGATVAFDVTDGAGTFDYTGVNTITDPFSFQTKVVTGSDGIARANWLPTAGANAATATGVGIGCSTFDNDADASDDCVITDGPVPPAPASLDGTGPFGDNALSRPRIKMDLATGVTSFNAFACSPRPANFAADGVVEMGEYPLSNRRAFTAKLSGGEVPATVYWTNDCTDLYIAVTAATDEEGDNPPLRLVFDNNADGFEDVGDDILFIDRTSQSVKGTKIYTWTYSDLFLTEDCLADNAKSDCGDPDPTGFQEGDGEFNFAPGLATWEFRHKLDSGDPDHDFALSLLPPNNQVGFYVVFQLGSGPKGGVIYPGLESYIPINISP
jgi:hypothetical protein